MSQQLEEKAAWLRREVFEMVVRAKKGHFPSSSSCTEILVSLMYGGHLKFDPKNPKWEDRDRLFISKGHAGMALYPILADLGYISAKEVPKFTKPDGILKFYPDPNIPGVEAITGSLGHGIGIAVGHLLAGRNDGRSFYSYVIISDGECYEGSTWEAALFAAHQNLGNLVVFVDRNGCCILDHTEKCVRLDPLEEKWKAFGWHTRSIDAHDFTAISEVLEEARSGKIKKPIAIIANSIKGKGVSFMENKPSWHNKMPNEEQIAQARRELGITPAVLN
jgi:transketolase